MEPGVFTPNIQTGVRFTFRKWFDAKDFSENNQIQIIKSSDGKQYPTGFHYYLNLESAILRYTRDEIIAKIKIKNILTTGFESDEQVGVSEYIMLMKIVKNSFMPDKYKIDPRINDIITESLKPLLNVLRYSRGKVSDKTVQKIGELASKTDEDFINYITVIESLNRQGEAFRIATGIHRRAIHSVPKYSDYHNRVIEYPRSSLLNKIRTRGDELSKQGYQNL